MYIGNTARKWRIRGSMDQIPAESPTGYSPVNKNRAHTAQGRVKGRIKMFDKSLHTGHKTN